MSKVLSVRVPDELAEWADSYAQSRGVSRQVLLENALAGFKEDCETGVPQLRDRIRAVRDVPEAGRTRDDFNRLTAARADLFSRLKTPDSVRGLAKPGQPPKDAA